MTENDQTAACTSAIDSAIDRRRTVRYEQHLPLSLWFRHRGRLNRITAESLDVSETGLRFVCRLQFDDDTLYVSTPESEMQKEFAEVRIVRRRRLGDGRWEYGARVESLLVPGAG